MITEIQVYDGSGVDPHLHCKVFADIIVTQQQMRSGYRQLEMIFYAESDMRAAFKTLQENHEIAYLEIMNEKAAGLAIHHVKRVWVEDFSSPWRIIFQFNASGIFPFTRQPG